MKEIQIIRPDDWHVHLRGAAMLPYTLAHANSQFGRILAMPNLNPPITKIQDVNQYADSIAASTETASQLQVYYTLYLTDNTSSAEVAAASADERVIAVKWYPAGATTNSDHGVTTIDKCLPLLELMQETGLVLSIHGEVTDSKVDIFDREAVFIDTILDPLRRRFPRLRMVLEHISSAVAADYVADANSDSLAATITPHHLLIDRNDLLVGGIKPHLYCLPIVKRSSDREALLQAATSGKACFFLGSDSAPHERKEKESACGCAGCYHGDYTLALYAMAFDSVNKIDQLENFASVYGCRYYGMQPSKEHVRLVRDNWSAPQSYRFSGQENIVPLFAGRTIHWQLIDNRSSGAL